MSTIYRFNHAKLRGKIKEVFGSETRLSEVVGMPNNTLSRKLNGLSAFNQNEILVISQALGIPSTEIADYFFVCT